MMRRLLFVVPVLLFAAVAGYLLVGLGRDPQRLPSALISQPAPEFNLPPLAGREASGVETGLSTDDLKRGEPVLVNVFSSWCGPCRIEHPLLAKLAAERRIKIFGINYKDRPEDALGFLQQLGDPYARVGVDPKGRTAIELGVYGVPETFLIDGEGIIRYRFPGPLDPNEIERNLVPLIEKLQG